MGLRRKSRELALQFLFSHDFQDGFQPEKSLEEDFAMFCALYEVGKKYQPYGLHLIQGIRQSVSDIDKLLAEHSHHWRVERMSSVDRNILRIAVYEMLHVADAPGQVAINEALEIAKRYSIDDSVSFINGILDAVQSSLTR